MRKAVLILSLVALTLVLVPAALADGPATDRAGRAEVRFLQGMIDHHQMALDMAADCLNKATTASVRALCQNIIDAQTAEILIMRGWLLVWYQVDYHPMPMSHMMHTMGMMDGMHMGGMRMGGMMGGVATPAGPHAGHGMGSSATPPGPGMMGRMPDDPPMMMGMMAGLSRLEGRAYEIAWLEAMIDHHDDALRMSSRILERAQHAELRALAEQIIRDQTAEIEQMEAMIAELGAS